MPNFFCRAFARALGAIDDVDALHFAREQREYHRARAATCAEHHGRGQPAIPPGRRGIEIGKETFDVGIGRAQFAIVIPKRIGGADRARALVGLASI